MTDISNSIIFSDVIKLYEKHLNDPYNSMGGWHVHDYSSSVTMFGHPYKPSKTARIEIKVKGKPTRYFSFKEIK